MPKANDRMTRSQVKEARRIHKEVLNENKLLKKSVDDNLKGLKGTDRQKAWAVRIRLLFSENPQYKAEVRRRFKKAGLPTLSA
jgi:hypothetical protein